MMISLKAEPPSPTFEKKISEKERDSALTTDRGRNSIPRTVKEGKTSSYVCEKLEVL
jgi:hypothetical protein